MICSCSWPPCGTCQSAHERASRSRAVRQQSRRWARWRSCIARPLWTTQCRRSGITHSIRRISRSASGRLKEPEELEEGNVVRTTASASWLKHDGENFTAVTAAYGVNDGEEATRGALLIEATKRAGRYTGYGRVEFVEVETGTLLDDHDLGHAAKDTVAAITLGAVRELPRWRRLESGIGAAVT